MAKQDYTFERCQFEAYLTQEQLDNFEKANLEHLQHCRMALVLLTKSKTELLTLAESKQHELIDIADGLKTALGFYQFVVKMIDMAHFRLMYCGTLLK